MSFYLQAKNINGSVTTQGHEQWVELKSFDTGVSRNITVRSGHVTDRETGSPKIGDFVITKELDKSSPHFYEASLVGTSLGEVRIDACGASSDANKYLQYTLSDVMVSHYDISGGAEEGSSDKPIETLHLNFVKVEMKYVPRNSANKTLAPISVGYDVEKATSL